MLFPLTGMLFLPSPPGKMYPSRPIRVCPLMCSPLLAKQNSKPLSPVSPHCLYPVMNSLHTEPWAFLGRSWVFLQVSWCASLEHTANLSKSCSLFPVGFAAVCSVASVSPSLGFPGERFFSDCPSAAESPIPPYQGNHLGPSLHIPFGERETRSSCWASPQFVGLKLDLGCPRGMSESPSWLRKVFGCSAWVMKDQERP